MHVSVVCRKLNSFYVNRSTRLLFNALTVEKHPSRFLSSSTLKTQQTLRTQNRVLLNKLTHIPARYEHGSKRVEFKIGKMPKKYMDPFSTVKLILKFGLFGYKSFEKEFLNGVVGAFLHISECIVQGKSETLHGILTEDALVGARQYANDAQTGNGNIYNVLEEDLMIVKGTALQFNNTNQDDGNVTILTTDVWFAYSKNCQKILQENDLAKDDGRSTYQKLSDTFTAIQKDGIHAEMQFQRVYDKSLKNALTDWVISRVEYKMERDFSDY